MAAEALSLVLPDRTAHNPATAELLINPVFVFPNQTLVRRTFTTYVVVTTRPTRTVVMLVLTGFRFNILVDASPSLTPLLAATTVKPTRMVKTFLPQTVVMSVCAKQVRFSALREDVPKRKGES